MIQIQLVFLTLKNTRRELRHNKRQGHIELLHTVIDGIHVMDQISLCQKFKSKMIFLYGNL